MQESGHDSAPTLQPGDLPLRMWLWWVTSQLVLSRFDKIQEKVSVTLSPVPDGTLFNKQDLIEETFHPFICFSKGFVPTAINFC